MNKERLVNTFLDLVRIPSPSRNERRVADYILNFCNANGIEVYEDDANIEYGGNAGNIVAILRAENKKRLMFSAHMDTCLLYTSQAKLLNILHILKALLMISYLKSSV